MAATVESVAGDLEAARRYLEQAEEITPGLHDFPATIELLLSRAVLALVEGDLETARAVCLEGVRLSREAGDMYQVEAMLGNLGMVGVMAGDLDSALSRGVEALRVARQIDNRLGQYYGLAALGWRAASSGQARLAAQLLGAALGAAIVLVLYPAAGAGSPATGRHLDDVVVPHPPAASTADHR